MIEALFNQNNYVATKKMLDATVLRHEAIAGNLANIETPNYKRLDIAPSFSAELGRAMASRSSERVESLQPRLAVDTTAVASRRDGNTVQLENELVRLGQNSLAHTLEAQMLTGTLLKMRLAITGRP
jgi:flagellar basal-body rod protein FlgB